MLHSKIDHIIQEDTPNQMQIAKIQMQMLGSIESQVAELRRLQTELEATARADMPVDPESGNQGHK